MAETIKIGGELESMATGNKVADVANIKDKTQGNKSQAAINTEHEIALADRYTKSETYNKTELNNMITTPNQEFVSVVATDQTTAATDVLPATGEADTIYRVGNWDGTQYNDSVFSEYAWNGSAYIKLDTKSQIGEVYDISANHADTKYANLSAALGVDGANIPQSLRRGGMSIKYVCSSDNNYVQCRLMSDSFNTTVTNWQGVDDEPTAGSNNLVTSGGTEKQLAIRKKLFLDDSDFSKIPISLISYSTTNLVDKSKEYYLHTCGIRNNYKAQTIVQIYDENDTSVEQVIFNGSDNKLHLVQCAGFLLTIDASLLTNSSANFETYNLHLDKYANAQLIDSNVTSTGVNPVNGKAVYKELAKKVSLFLSDSDFSKIPYALISYNTTNQVDFTKEYYIHTCGIRNSNKGQVIVSIYDENDTVIEQQSFNGNDNKLHNILCAGFMFSIDASLLENSSSDFIVYDLHLDKYRGRVLYDTTPTLGSTKPVTSDGIKKQDLLKKDGLFLSDSDFSKIPTGLINIDYSRIDSVNEPVPNDLYLTTLGYRNNAPNASLIVIKDNQDNIVSQKYFDASSGNIIDIVLKGIVFTINCAQLPVNTTGAFITYNMHLNRSYYCLNSLFNRNRFDFETGKIIVSMGDSITQGLAVGDGYDYPSIMAKYLKAKAYNIGIGGRTFSTETAGSFCDMVDAIISNDWTDIDAVVESLVEDYPYLQTRFAAFKQLNFSNVDIVTIGYGTNDWNFGYTLDNENNLFDKTTILGALRYGVTKLLENYPKLHIYIFTPTYRWFEKDGQGVIISDSDNTTRGSNPIYLKQVSDAIYNACNELHVPCKKEYNECLMSKYTATYYIADKTHPNIKGNELLASQFAKFIDSF